ncbi:spermatogenesis-associated protein 32 [Ctenodactylus gundi]
MPTPETSRHWSTNSNYSYMNSVEEARVAPKHRSIHAQTSNHLFWADKFIQTSECSLQKATSTQCDQSGTETTTRCPEQESIPKDTLCSEKQLQMPRTDPALPSASSQQPPSSEPSCTSLPDTTELAELVQLATSLALASTNNVNLPNLEHIFEAAPKKAKEPSREPSQLTTEEGKLPEKPPEATEPQKAPNQGDKNFPYSYLNLSRQEGKRAAIEGKMQFLEPVTVSSELQGAEDDSVPGTKKGNPLLLKINFKLSPPQTTQK